MCKRLDLFGFHDEAFGLVGLGFTNDYPPVPQEIFNGTTKRDWIQFRKRLDLNAKIVPGRGIVGQKVDATRVSSSRHTFQPI